MYIVTVNSIDTVDNREALKNDAVNTRIRNGDKRGEMSMWPMYSQNRSSSPALKSVEVDCMAV